MATLESGAAVASGIIIIAVAALVFIVPQSDQFQTPISPLPNTSSLAPPIVQERMPLENPGQITPTSQIPLVRIFEYAKGSVVSVRVETPDDTGEMFGAGSGFVYDTQGHIITNAHVVNGATRITVTFLDGRSYNAEIVGADVYTDTAVLKTEQVIERLEPLRLGDSTSLKVGQPVAAIGNPFGLSGSMTTGIVSQLGRLLPAQNSDFSIPGIIQTDAPINPGNSGGPLLNFAAEVIGMNTAIQTTTGQFAGIGFAIPSKTVLKIVPYLISDGTYHHPWIGVSGIDIYPDLADELDLADSRGFLVSEVIDGSPADAAGIHGTTHMIEINGRPVAVGGDIILAVDGNDVRKIDDILIHLQREKSVGDEMELRVFRDGSEYLVTLVLEERPRVE